MVVNTKGLSWAMMMMMMMIVGVMTQSPIIVKTLNGNVQGLSYPQGYSMFKGIPYATPPVGSLRWQPPVEAPSWAPNTLNATSYLNVWAPANAKGLPVMIFFPGGNYRQDAASTDLYWGEYMPAAGSVVLVTVNYRLGALAFLVTENWAQGNLGLKDQRLAMHWVQDNIVPFGGDPSQVTIFGQSAGAESVIIHTYSPFSMGQNLFHRVVCMSGSLGIGFKDLKQQLAVGKDFAKEIGCDVSDQACFLNKTSSEVLVAQLATKPFPWPNTFMKAYEWSPTIGSDEVPYQALDALAKGNFTAVPIIMGTLMEEGVQFVDMLFTSAMTKAEYEAAIVAVFGLPASKILAAYPCPANETSDCRPVMAQVATHKVFSCPTRNAARTIAKQAPQVADSIYVYFYDHPLSFPGWGANFSFCNDHVCHGSELPVLYNSATSYGFQFQPNEITLALQMEQFWGKFANGATGPISISGSSVSSVLVAWPTYNEADGYSIRLDVGALETEQHRLDTICDMWDEIGYY